MSNPTAATPADSALEKIRARIARARVLSRVGQPRVELLAVSKTVPAERVAELYAQGQRDFAENYAQELIEKSEAFARLGLTGARWHFIGHLQTNKVKALLPFVASIHSVDSEKIAREIAKRWSALGRADKLPVFIEVNIDAETNKAGVAPSEAPALAELIGHELGKELELQGLMCVPAVGGIPNTRGSGFARLRELEAKCRPWSKGQLSMGMSSDFEAAIAEGATQVRVGTALFGKR